MYQKTFAKLTSRPSLLQRALAITLTERELPCEHPYRRFYNFDGLDTFKAKFQPDGWDSVYATANEAKFSPSTLHAIPSAFTLVPPKPGR